MNPRKIRAWAGRVLLAAGIALGVLLGTQVSASAEPEWGSSTTTTQSIESDSASVQMEPEWG